MNDRHQISPYPIRMPEELRSRLEEAAKDGNRSLHAEILARLESSFSTSEAPGQKQIQVITDEVTGRISLLVEKAVRVGIAQAIGRTNKQPISVDTKSLLDALPPIETFLPPSKD